MDVSKDAAALEAEQRRQAAEIGHEIGEPDIEAAPEPDPQLGATPNDPAQSLSLEDELAADVGDSPGWTSRGGMAPQQESALAYNNWIVDGLAAEHERGLDHDAASQEIDRVIDEPAPGEATRDVHHDALERQLESAELGAGRETHDAMLEQFDRGIDAPERPQEPDIAVAPAGPEISA